jgi:hypothetical protein
LSHFTLTGCGAGPLHCPPPRTSDQHSPIFCARMASPRRSPNTWKWANCGISRCGMSLGLDCGAVSGTRLGRGSRRAMHRGHYSVLFCVANLHALAQAIGRQMREARCLERPKPSSKTQLMKRRGLDRGLGAGRAPGSGSGSARASLGSLEGHSWRGTSLTHHPAFLSLCLRQSSYQSELGRAGI